MIMNYSNPCKETNRAVTKSEKKVGEDNYSETKRNKKKKHLEALWQKMQLPALQCEIRVLIILKTRPPITSVIVHG